MRKDGEVVLFPEKLSFMTSELMQYRLVAVVVHVGSSHNEGHFVTFRRLSAPKADILDPPDDVDESAPSDLDGGNREAQFPRFQAQPASIWICASDEEVAPVSLETVLRTNPYLIFYERI